MNNLLTDHPCPQVRTAALRLLDALCSWERSTGRDNIVIIKDAIGCELRTLSGAAQPQEITDAQLLEAFSNLAL